MRVVGVGVVGAGYVCVVGVIGVVTTGALGEPGVVSTGAVTVGDVIGLGSGAVVTVGVVGVGAGDLVESVGVRETVDQVVCVVGVPPLTTVRVVVETVSPGDGCETRVTVRCGAGGVLRVDEDAGGAYVDAGDGLVTEATVGVVSEGVDDGDAA